MGTALRTRTPEAAGLEDVESAGSWLGPVLVSLLIAAIVGTAAWAARTDQPSSPDSVFSLPAPAGSAQALCRSPVARELPGARAIFVSSDSSLWSIGGEVVLCAINGGRVSVLRTGTADLDSTSVALTVVVSGYGPYVPHRRYIAAGLVPSHVRAIVYRFPDGQRVQAHLVDDGPGQRWWLVDYSPIRGVLTDLQVPLSTVARAQVTVVSVDGRRTLSPEWPDGT